jgi:zinc D-Ala-D-Ala carboxypeptidase
MKLHNLNPSDVLALYIDQLGPTFKLSRNLQLREFASKCGSNQVLIHPALIVAFQAIRDSIGKPIRINSGYRSPSHNAKVGGASESLHTKGMAMDLSSDFATPAEIQAIADSLGLVTRIYPTFVHVDCGKFRKW